MSGEESNTNLNAPQGASGKKKKKVKTVTLTLAEYQRLKSDQVRGYNARSRRAYQRLQYYNPQNVPIVQATAGGYFRSNCCRTKKVMVESLKRKACPRHERARCKRCGRRATIMPVGPDAENKWDLYCPCSKKPRRIVYKVVRHEYVKGLMVHDLFDRIKDNGVRLIVWRRDKADDETTILKNLYETTNNKEGIPITFTVVDGCPKEFAEWVEKLPNRASIRKIFPKGGSKSRPSPTERGTGVRHPSTHRDNTERS